MVEELHTRFNKLCDQLLSTRNDKGFWEGKLSGSALSTAVAIVTLKLSRTSDDERRVDDGLNWLSDNQNFDGGFGDTPKSISNVSTSLLVYAALYYCNTPRGNTILSEVGKYLSSQNVSPEAGNVVESVLAFYGKDLTFSVPILSMLSVSGAIPPGSLKKIPQLPFELALLPASWYRFLNLHVVSYALPALIGVGIYTHKKISKGVRRIMGFHREWFVNSAIRKLESIMPESGGFLEAIPLTAFVCMCLIESGFERNAVVEKGLDFLRTQQRPDGSWPIDTNLSTWVTTLSVKALGPEVKNIIKKNEIDQLRSYLLSLQYTKTHAFNNAAPGGWGWTGFSGSVPDADDTPGAILALLELYNKTEEEIIAIEKGCLWLVDIQNSDGGFPTFCKGWSKLPFDKSCADLTGHALLALMKSVQVLSTHLTPETLKVIDTSIHMGMGYLIKEQDTNGAWLPLWFGNQHTADKTNPVYGTAKVCIYLNDCLNTGYPDREFLDHLGNLADKARRYIITQQNDDGSWGGHKGIPGTVEETSLAISALAGYSVENCKKGFVWLSQQHEIRPSPIGLYFAMLWYHEKLYPLIYYTEALRRYNQ